MAVNQIYHFRLLVLETYMRPLLKFVIALSALCFSVTVGCSWLNVQSIRGWKVYQVQSGHIKWAYIVRFPGYEQVYNHESNGIESKYYLYARHRVSPWFDTGKTSSAPIDNPLNEQTTK